MTGNKGANSQTKTYATRSSKTDNTDTQVDLNTTVLNIDENMLEENNGDKQMIKYLAEEIKAIKLNAKKQQELLLEDSNKKEISLTNTIKNLNEQINKLREENRIIKENASESQAALSNSQRSLTSGGMSSDQRVTISGAQNIGLPTNQANIDVSHLVNGLRSVNIDFRPPKFEGTARENPKEFLNKFDQFCLIKRIDNSVKLFLMGTCLEGRALTWFEAQAFTDFDTFRQSFTDEFYSIRAQAHMRSAWINRRYSQQDGSFHTYFFDQIKKARYFEPPLKTYDLHYTIVQQFPLFIRNMLSSADYTNIDLIVQVLDHYDTTNSEKENQKNQTYTSQGQGRNHSHIRHLSAQQSNYRRNNRSRNNNYFSNQNQSYQFNDPIVQKSSVNSIPTLQSNQNGNPQNYYSYQNQPSLPQSNNNFSFPNFSIPPPPINNNQNRLN